MSTTATMAPKRTAKATKRAVTTSNLTPLLVVTLGEEITKDKDELASSSPSLDEP
jgi:hypothetical protein